MKEQAARLVAARREYDDLDAQMNAKKTAFIDSVDALAGLLAVSVAELKIAEASLRIAGLEYYQANPNTKKLPYGVGIRATETLIYEDYAAFSWAVEHNMALTLDKKAFEKIAKVSLPDFVTVEEVLTVTLPSDSAKLLQD